jgi:serine protease AprX
MIPARRSALPALFLALFPLCASLWAAASPSDTLKIWVTLKDKGPDAGPAAPGHAAPGPTGSAARAARAYENRPLHEPYLAALRANGFAPDARLKWQNRVSGRIAAGKAAGLKALPFVAEVSELPRKARSAWTPPVSPRSWPRGGRGGSGSAGAAGAAGRLGKIGADDIDYGAGRPLIDSLRVRKLHTLLSATGRVPGQGVRVAVIDADFHLGSPIFAAMKSNIRDQWDFVANQPKAVTDEFINSHGGACMSLIGGNLPGTLVGAAPAAEFLLYRAEEDAQERYVEEDWVAAAIERAVDSGAQVISISLGYRYDYTDGSPDRPYPEFDGRTRPSSLAALGAARRNVLVSISMGNEGGLAGPSNPATLSAPADADSILGVGIVDRFRNRCGYSSTGPSADGRIKPDLVSMGILNCTVAVAATDSSVADVVDFAGTSFSAPAIAGVAALLRQLAPEKSAEEIRQAMIRTADNRANPDNLVGYGLVDAAAAAQALGAPVSPVLAVAGLSRIYIRGGLDPIILDWEPGAAKPSLQLLDLSGRVIPIAVTAVGPQLFVSPARALQTGVYIARVR